MTANYSPQIAPYVEAVKGMKANEVVILDVRGISDFADTFILCSGRSHRQVSAIAENVQRILRKKKIKALGVEGLKEGLWVLMDYDDVIIHIFYEPTREFYDLEGLWVDAARTNVADAVA